MSYMINHSLFMELHAKQKSKQKQIPWQERSILNQYGLSDLTTVGETRAIKKQSNTISNDSKNTTEVDPVHK